MTSILVGAQVTNNVRHFERVPDLKLENWATEEDHSTNGHRGME